MGYYIMKAIQIIGVVLNMKKVGVRIGVENEVDPMLIVRVNNYFID